ncbi:uncharacterized protein LOC144582327 isoform X1 [Callithrix jacchus]
MGAWKGASGRGPPGWGRGMASLIPPYQLEGKGVRGRRAPPIHSAPGGTAARSQILRCSGRTAENHHPPGALRPHPWHARAGYAHVTPPVSLPVWPMEELRMARPARAWQSPVALCMEAWEDFVGRGGERGCRRLWGYGFRTPSNRPLSLESANHNPANWLGDVAGCHFPVGLCGTLPGD